MPTHTSECKNKTQNMKLIFQIGCLMCNDGPTEGNRKNLLADYLLLKVGN